MIKYTTIATENERFQLSALIENGDYTDVILTINNPENGEMVDIWDNESWVMNNLYYFLITDPKSLEVHDHGEETDVVEELDRVEVFDDEYDELREILEEGIKTFYSGPVND